MRKFFSLIALLGVAFAQTEQFKLEMTFEADKTQKLAIGMSKNATNGFDKGVDAPAPPISMMPPIGFYPIIVFSDPDMPYIDAAWTDMRAPSSNATWKILLHDARERVTITWDAKLLPQNRLTVNGIEMMSLVGKYTVPSQDSILIFEYSQGAVPPQHTTTINFKLAKNSIVTAKIKDTSGKLVDTVEFGTLVAGEHSKNWAHQNVPAGVYVCELYAGDELISYVRLAIVGN